MNIKYSHTVLAKLKGRLKLSRDYVLTIQYYPKKRFLIFKYSHHL